MASAVARASAIMASGTMVSRVLGFVKTILLIVAIGNVGSLSADAFGQANQIPNTIYMALAGGVVNAVLVPQIVKAAQNPDGGRAYINKVLTLVTTVLLGITVIAMIAAPVLVWIFTLDFAPDQRALAVAFAYWCLPQILFYGWYTVLGEMLNAKKIFGPFTWAPALANVIAILGTVAFILVFGASNHPPISGWTPASIALLAGSATLGVAAQAVILFVVWRRTGIRLRPDFAWRGVGLRVTGRIAGWGLASILVLQLGGIVTGNVLNTASGKGASFFAAQNAWLVFMLPHSVIAVSMLTAYFTRMSELAQGGRIAEFRDEIAASMKQILMLMLLAQAMFFVAAPFVSRVMQPSASAEGVDSFAIVLQGYSVGLAAYSFMFIVQRAFFALSDARTPFVFMSAQLVALVIGTLIVAVLVPPQHLVLAYSIVWSLTTIAQAVFALWLLRRRLDGVHGRSVLQSLVRYLIAAIPTVVIGWLLTGVLRGIAIQTSGFGGLVLSVVFALACSAVMGIVYFGVLVALRAPELRNVMRRLRRQR